MSGDTVLIGDPIVLLCALTVFLVGMYIGYHLDRNGK